MVLPLLPVLCCLVTVKAYYVRLFSKDVRLTETDESVTAAIGQQIRLPCHSLDGSPVEWWFLEQLNGRKTSIFINGELLASYKSAARIDDVTPNDFSLVLNSVQFKNSGVYSCWLEQGRGDRFNIRLNVTRYLLANVDEAFTLPCYSKMNAEWWFKLENGPQRPIFSYGRAFDARLSVPRLTIGDYSLLVKNAQLDDSGFYNCTATANAVQVIVKLAAAVGNAITLPCRTSVVGDVDWYYFRTLTPSAYQQLIYTKGVKTEFGGRFHINDDYSLFIEHLTCNDSGLYICTENDGRGSRHYMQLEVVGPSTETFDFTTSSLLVTMTNSLMTIDQWTSKSSTVVLVGVCVFLTAAATSVTVVVIFIVCKRRQSKMRTNGNSVSGYFTVATDEARFQTTRESVLPAEMLEMILNKAVILFFTKDMNQSSSADIKSLRKMTSCCKEWWAIISDRRRQIRTAMNHKYGVRRMRPVAKCQVQVSGTVTGIAELGGKLLVVCSESDTVRKFSSSDGHFQHIGDICIPQLKDPSDIVACNDYQQLFIADRGQECGQSIVWRVELGDGDVPIGTPQAIREDAKSLSLSAGLLTVTHTELTKPQLTVYDHTGSRVKEIPLANYMQPWHSISTGDRGLFLVSFSNPVDEKDQVCALDRSGKVEVLFGERRGSGKDELIEPSYLASDCNGHIFVADSQNCRVVLLNADLKPEKIFFFEQKPTKLCYLPSSNQMIVLFSGNELKVFDIHCLEPVACN